MRGLLITLMMEVVSIFETSASFYQTPRRSIPEDTRLHFDFGLLNCEGVQCCVVVYEHTASVFRVVMRCLKPIYA